MSHPFKHHLPFIDLHAECVFDSLEVKGVLPSWLEGTLMRNGPAQFHFGSHMISHWFDGMAMLHAFSFSHGKVSYRNKFLRSDAYLNAEKTGNLHFFGFMQDPCWSIFRRFFTFFFPSWTRTLVQNANVNIMRIAGDYVALTETPLPVRFDPKTLDTLGVLNYQDRLARQYAFESAHPHHDFERRQIINYQIEFGTSCVYSVYTVDDFSPAKRKPFFKMKTDRAAYMHSFALTELYVVLVEYPLLLNPIDLILKGGGFISQFKWLPARGTRFIVIDRSTGKLAQMLETEAFFCFHHVNAYEDHGNVIIDLVRYPDPQIVYGAVPLDQMRTLSRFKLDLKGGKISEQIIAETLLELPRIYYQRHNGKPYRYAYGVGFKALSDPKDSIAIIKADVLKKTTSEWIEEGCLAGEPIFVPEPQGIDEDDGVLLSVVLDNRGKRTFLVVLDARDLHVIAKAEVPLEIPYGLHGMFV